MPQLWWLLLAIGVVLWAQPDKVYPAKVREIAPAVDAATRTFAVRVSILAPEAAVQWGMTANVVLQGEAGSLTALVPSTAIYHAQDGRPAVWIYDPARRTVEVDAFCSWSACRMKMRSSARARIGLTL